MVSWKGALALVAVLGLLGYFAYQARQPHPAKDAPRLFPCDITNALSLSEEGPGGASTAVARTGLHEVWTVTAPRPGAADQDLAREFVDSFYSVRQINVVGPGDAAQFGLDKPREVLTCHVNGGTSYTLTIGKESFDGSGFYALKGGDDRVYVISSVPVDEFDRLLKAPPYKAGAGASPSSSPTT